MKQSKYKKRGWYGESRRHYLAAKGISTSKRKTTSKYARRYNYTPTYAAGDLPLIAADGVGTVGAAAVPLLPLVVFSGLAYAGAKHVKNKKDKTGSYFKHKEFEGIEDDHQIAWKLNPAVRHVEMDVDEFLNRAGDIRHDESLLPFYNEELQERRPLFELSKLMSEGREIDAPFMESRNIGGLHIHEGRHRAIAAEMLGKKKIPVAVDFPEEYLSDEVFDRWWDKMDFSGDEYKNTWKRRFKTGRPTEGMDKKSRKEFFNVLKELNVDLSDKRRIHPDKGDIKYMAIK